MSASASGSQDSAKSAAGPEAKRRASTHVFADGENDEGRSGSGLDNRLIGTDGAADMDGPALLGLHVAHNLAHQTGKLRSEGAGTAKMDG
jgi:hypothetical protein